MDSTAIVTATAWVPRGFAAQFPLRKEFDEKEFERIAGLARLQLDDAKGDMEEAKNGGGKSDGDDNDDGMEIEEGDVASRKKDGTSTGAAEESKKSTDEIIG